MKKKILFTAVLSLVLLSGISRTFGFDTKGHIAIENRAYELLKQEPNGPAAILALQQARLLKRNLKPHSTYPDFSWERQFAQDRQMYHFMAPDKAVLDAAKEATLAARQDKLMHLALPDCLEMMYYYFRETIDNPVGASEAGRGLYVLMHIIADSYSPEHSYRDSNKKIVTVKGWKLSRFEHWPVNAKDTVNQGPVPTLSLLHNTGKKTADYAWGTPCNLSETAEDAAIAIKEMLLAAYFAEQHPGSADAVWKTYIKTHFSPAGGTARAENFEFDASEHTIRYAFDSLYNAYKKKRRYEYVFDFDRFPMVNINILSQFLKKEPGVELEFYRTPRSADNAWVHLNRLLFSVGLSAYKALNTSVPDKEAFHTNLTLGVNFTAPWLGTHLQFKAGAGTRPFSADPEPGFVGGVDLSWKLGGFFGDVYSTNFGIGYQFDRWNVRNSNALRLKLGVNIWQGRRINNTN